MAAFMSGVDRSDQEHIPPTHITSQRALQSPMATEKHGSSFNSQRLLSGESDSDDHDVDEDMPLFTTGRDAFPVTSASRASSLRDPSSSTSPENDKDINNTLSQRSPLLRQNSSLIDEDEEEEGESEVKSLQVQRRRHRAILSDSDDDDI